MTDVHADKTDSSAPLPSMRFVLLLRAVILGAVFFIGETFLWYADVSSFYIFLVELAELAATAVLLFIAVRWLVRKRYSSALSLFLVAAFMLSAFPVPSGLLSLSLFGSRDVIHLIHPDEAAYQIKFSLHQKRYLEEIKLIHPDSNGFRYKTFDWGHGATDWTGLVFDESDEFDLPEISRSEAWWTKVGGHDGILSCPHSVYKIKPHFFVVSEVCR